MISISSFNILHLIIIILISIVSSWIIAGMYVLFTERKLIENQISQGFITKNRLLLLLLWPGVYLNKISSNIDSNLKK